MRSAQAPGPTPETLGLGRPYLHGLGVSGHGIGGHRPRQNGGVVTRLARRIGQVLCLAVFVPMLVLPILASLPGLRQLESQEKGHQ